MLKKGILFVGMLATFWTNGQQVSQSNCKEAGMLITDQGIIVSATQGSKKNKKLIINHYDKELKPVFSGEIDCGDAKSTMLSKRPGGYVVTLNKNLLGTENTQVYTDEQLKELSRVNIGKTQSKAFRSLQSGKNKEAYMPNYIPRVMAGDRAFYQVNKELAVELKYNNMVSLPPMVISSMNKNAYEGETAIWGLKPATFEDHQVYRVAWEIDLSEYTEVSMVKWHADPFRANRLYLFLAENKGKDRKENHVLCVDTETQKVVYKTSLKLDSQADQFLFSDLTVNEEGEVWISGNYQEAVNKKTIGADGIITFHLGGEGAVKEKKKIGYDTLGKLTINKKKMKNQISRTSNIFWKDGQLHLWLENFAMFIPPPPTGQEGFSGLTVQLVQGPKFVIYSYGMSMVKLNADLSLSDVSHLPIQVEKGGKFKSVTKRDDLRGISDNIYSYILNRDFVHSPAHIRIAPDADHVLYSADRQLIKATRVNGDEWKHELIGENEWIYNANVASGYGFDTYVIYPKDEQHFYFLQEAESGYKLSVEKY